MLPPSEISTDPPFSPQPPSEDGSTAPNDVETLNVEWSVLNTAGPTPSERQWSATAVLGHQIFVFGGVAKHNNTSKYLGDFFQYDSELRKWTDLSSETNHPAARHSATMVAHGNRLYLFGGCGEGQVPLSDLWLFDITTKKWTKVKKVAPHEDSASLQETRQQLPKRIPPRLPGPTSAKPQVSNGTLWAASKASPAGAPASKPGKEEWPRARYLHSAVVYNDGMFVYGGWMADWSKGEHVWRLDLTSLTWTELELSRSTPVPDRRFGHIAAVWDHRMNIFGGSRSTKTTGELWSFDLINRRWTQIEASGPSPGPRKWHTGVVVESKWVVHGGVTGEVNQKENVEQPEFRMDAFSFDFRTSSWAHLPQLTSRDDSYPVEGHSGCIVSSEFSHTFYLLFGRRKATGTPQQAFVLDFFRPAAHLQIEDDEAALSAASRFIEHRSSQFFRSNITQLSEQLAPMRNSFEDDVLPALEKQLRKVASKIASSIGESDEVVLTDDGRYNNGDESVLLKQIVEGLSDIDRMFGAEGSRSPSALNTFVTSLATVLQCSADDITRFVNGEVLAEETIENLRRAAPALQMLEDYRGETAAEYILPGVEQIHDVHDVPLSRVSRAFINKAGEAAEIYHRTSESLKDGNLQPKQRRSIEIQKTEAGKELLERLDEKMTDVIETFKTSPLGEKICIERLLESFEIKKASIDSDVTACKRAAAKQEKILSYLNKVEREKRRVSTEALSEFEEKRSGFVSQRTALLEEVRAFLEIKLDAYSVILQEERQLILDAELYKREADEMSRRVSDMKQSADVPRLQKTIAQYTFTDVVAPVLDVLVEEQKCVLGDLERTVGGLCAIIAGDTAQDVARFKHLMDEVHGQLERQLAAQENSLKLLQSRIESKRDYLTVMMATSGTESAAEDGSPEEVESQIEQLELTLTNLHTDMEVARRSLADMDSLNEKFNTQVAVLKHVKETALTQTFLTAPDSFESWIESLAQSNPQRLSPMKGGRGLQRHLRQATKSSLVRPTPTFAGPKGGKAPVSSRASTVLSTTRTINGTVNATVNGAVNATVNRLDVNRFGTKRAESTAKVTGSSVPGNSMNATVSGYKPTSRFVTSNPARPRTITNLTSAR